MTISLDITHFLVELLQSIYEILFQLMREDQILLLELIQDGNIE